MDGWVFPSVMVQTVTLSCFKGWQRFWFKNNVVRHVNQNVLVWSPDLWTWSLVNLQMGNNVFIYLFGEGRHEHHSCSPDSCLTSINNSPSGFFCDPSMLWSRGNLRWSVTPGSILFVHNLNTLDFDDFGTFESLMSINTSFELPTDLICSFHEPLAQSHFRSSQTWLSFLP